LRRFEDERVARGLRAQLAEWRERLERGERRLGWKIAFNAPAMQKQLELAAPLIGFMTSANEVEPGAELSLAGGTRIGVEAEIAIRIGEGATIAALAPALEVIDIDLPFDDLEKILGRNAFHRHVILGPADQGRAGGDLDGVTITMARDGQAEDPVVAADAMGDPAGVVELVAGLLGEAGEELRAGDVIISGALVIVWPQKGDRVEADFGPLGSLAISFGAT
jgi:2-keto-4-pentenoate hydratase